MDAKNSPVLSTPKHKTWQNHQGHDHCQEDPAYGIEMFCEIKLNTEDFKPVLSFTWSTPYFIAINWASSVHLSFYPTNIFS
jgi:hypothetical protein